VRPERSRTRAVASAQTRRSVPRRQCPFRAGLLCSFITFLVRAPAARGTELSGGQGRFHFTTRAEASRGGEAPPRRGADKEKADNDSGNNPMHLTCYDGHIEIIKLLFAEWCQWTPQNHSQFPADFQQKVAAIALAWQLPMVALNRELGDMVQQVAEETHAKMGLQ